MPVWLFFGAALRTNRELGKLDFSYFGQPFCWVPSNTSVVLEPMDYAYMGQPFISYARG